jgi:O-antigen/teichoic acid export membrane protein
MNVMLGRMLGVEAFGLFAFGFIVLTGLSIVVRFGHDNSLMKLGGIVLGEGRNGCFRLLVWQAVRFAIIVSAGVGLLLLLVVRVLLEPLGAWGLYQEILATASFVIIPFSLTFFVAAALRASGRPAMAPLFEMGTACMFVAGLIQVSVWLDLQLNPVGALKLLALMCLVLSIAGGIVIFRTVRPGSERDTRENCIPVNEKHLNQRFFVIAWTGYLAQWFAPLALSMFASVESVGLYNAAYSLSAAMGFILFVFNGILSPRVANAYARGDIGLVANLFSSSTRIATTIVVPIAAVYVVFAESLLSVYGEEFGKAAGILRLLAVGQLVNVAAGSVGLMLSMTGHEREIRNVFLGSAGLSVLLSFALVPSLKEWGAAVAVFVSLVGQNLVATYVVRKRLGISAYDFKWWK